MLSTFSGLLQTFARDEKGALPIEIGAAVLAAIAAALGFIVLLETMV